MTGSVNLIGLATLVRKEAGRFLKVYTQTILAPVVTTVLFYAVFATAFGGEGRTAGDLPYMTFLAPGLVMMAIAQNAFANTSSSIMISKVQGNIVDVLMPPLSPLELYAGYAAGGVLRGAVVGLVCWASVALFFTGAGIHSLFCVLAFTVLGSLMLSSLGIAGGLWSEKFDHIAAVTNFIVTPLTFLSGTFYALNALPEAWQAVARLNPFFYMIDGFRYGVTGYAEAPAAMGIAVLAAVNAVLGFACYALLKSGYKIKV